jgi:poly-beta-1,6-N-acetyl-D-glucosamine synthase
VTNRGSLLAGLQSLEAASIIGLTRRTQALGGRAAIVAGVLGIFRRTRVIEVGGYDGRMATEDIDLTWRLLMAGWLTSYEPNALVGMQVPSTLSSLWRQRRRWGCGQGEVLHEHFRKALRRQSWRFWTVVLGAVLSLAWVVGLVLAVIAATIAFFIDPPTSFGLGLACGIAIAFIATAQLAFAVALEARYDRPALFPFLLGPLYPLGFWAISALAAIREELPALWRGPREDRVVWDIPRERV